MKNIKDSISIDLKRMSFQYNNHKPIFTRLNLHFGDKFYYINGDSGAGKTTLLQLLAGWLSPSSGKIIFNDNLQNKKLILSDNNISDSKSLNYFRKQTGIIFQDFKLKPELSVYENVFDFVLMRQNKITVKQRKQAHNLLKSLGFNNINELKDKKINDLSGGEQQRIAIARALIVKPKIVLADEITSNLGVKDTARIVRLLENYSIRNHAMVLFATHDKNIIMHKPHPIFAINSFNHTINKFIYDSAKQKIIQK